MRSFIITIVDNNLQKINQSISNLFTALDFSLSLPVSWYLSRLFLLKALKTSSCCTTRFFCCNHFFKVVVVIFFQSPAYMYVCTWPSACLCWLLFTWARESRRKTSSWSASAAAWLAVVPLKEDYYERRINWDWPGSRGAYNPRVQHWSVKAIPASQTIDQ